MAFDALSDHTTSATDNRIENSGAEAAVARGNNALTVRDNGLGIGTNGKFISAGALDLSKANFGKFKGNLNISTTDPQVLALLESQGQAQSASYADLLENLNQQTTSQAQSQSGMFEKLFSGIKDLAESKQTDGQSGQNKTVVSVIVALVVGLVVWAIFRSKK